MAPIKFDEHIKEQLEQRSLSPSKNAWSKLDQRLDKHENKNKNKHFWWIGIAASFIGVLLVVSFLFKAENTSIETNVVVDTKQSDIIDVESFYKEKTLIKTTKEEQIAEINQDKVEQKIKGKQSIETKQQLTPKNTLKTQESIALKTTNNAVAEAKLENEKGAEILKVKTIQSQDIETLKAQEVVAQILELKKAKSAVTNDEIEALLDAAHKEITLQRLYNEDTKTVDADALLRGVEFDIEEESFRSKVFEMLKAGYKEIKTAVAERNN